MDNFTNKIVIKEAQDFASSILLDGLVGISIVWISCIYVNYIGYQLINYFIEKPPNRKTMLDGFYIQYFASSNGLASMLMIMQLLIELNAVFGLENSILTEITAWIFYDTLIFSSLSLATSCLARALSIFWPTKIENMDDKTVWLLNG